MKQDIYQKVTAKIIADLEQGELTWLKPWSAEHGRADRQAATPTPGLSGINVLML